VDINHVPPGRAHFDPALNAWVLTQYADVLAALLETRLCQIGPQSKGEVGIRDETRRRHKRAEVRAALPASLLLQWHRQIKLLADSMIDLLAANHSIDLVREFIRPWCLAITVLVTGTDSVRCQRLADLARDLPGGEAECYNSALRSRVVAVASELRKSFRSGGMPVCKSAFRTLSQTLQYSTGSVSLGLRRRLANPQFERLLKKGTTLNKSVFLGTSQTLPAFLSNAWLALLRHPTEYARLRAEPYLMPRAIEELLRYANIVHTLLRQATADLELGGVLIRRGERIILKLDAANRDPAQFSEPDRLDLNRRLTSQVVLGAGPHSCLGASIVRIAVSTATRAFIQNFVQAKLCSTVEWHTDPMVRFPVSLNVLLRRSAVDNNFAER
jgi:cytochrome P450